MTDRLVALVLVPGIRSYSLVDPWETHYGEVARMMLQEHDWVHTQWPGGESPKDNEGFRSKPVLQFWMMAAGMTRARRRRATAATRARWWRAHAR